MLTTAEFFLSVSTASVNTRNNCQHLLQLIEVHLTGTCQSMWR